MKALWGYGGRCWRDYQCALCGERLEVKGSMFTPVKNLYLLHPKANCQYSEIKFELPRVPPFETELQEIALAKARGESQ